MIAEEVTHDHDPYGESECIASNDSVQNRERRDQQNKRNRARRDRPEPGPTEQSMLQRPSRRTRTQCNARGVVPMIQRRKQRSAVEQSLVGAQGVGSERNAASSR